MPLIQDLIKKFTHKEEEQDDEPREIRDRYLESLRRERQVQMNEVEKAELKKLIRDYKIKKVREGMFGIKDKREKEKQYLGELKKEKVKLLQDKKIFNQKSILKQKSIMGGNNLLDNKKEEFKKVRIIM